MSNTSYIYELSLNRDFGPYRKGAKYIGQSNNIDKPYFTGGTWPRQISADVGKEIFTKRVVVSGKFNPTLLNELEKHYIQLYATDIRGFNLTKGGSRAPTSPEYQYICAYDLDGNFVADFNNRIEALAFAGQGTWFSKIHAVLDKQGRSRFGYQWRSFKVDNCGVFQNSSCSKPVVELDVEGRVVATFKSIGEVERRTGIGHTSISEACIDGTFPRGRIFMFKRNFDKLSQYDLAEFIANIRVPKVNKQAKALIPKIICNETGVQFLNARRAAEAMGFGKNGSNSIYSNLAGKYKRAYGFTFSYINTEV